MQHVPAQTADSQDGPEGRRPVSRSVRLFTDGLLDPDALGDERTAAVLLSAAERATERLRPGDLLHAVLDSRDLALLPAIEGALAEGAAPHHLLETLAVYAPAGNGYAFDGAREHVAPELEAAFEEFERRCERDGVGAQTRLELLLACVLDTPSADEREFLAPLLDLERAAEALRRQVGVQAAEPPELYDDASGRLRSEEFTEDAWAVLELAARRAAELGYDRLLPPHCLLALLAETEGPAERVFRLQLPLQVGLVKAVETITQAFRITERGDTAAPRLDRDGIGESLRDVLHAARTTAARWDAERTDTPHLLAALLDSPPQRLAAALAAEPLRLDIKRLRESVRDVLSESRSAAPREVPFRLPAFLPPSEDLTWLARTGAVGPAAHLDGYFEPLCRALHRSENNHVLITGLPGIGTTTLLRELARRATAGEIPFLRRKRFLRVDCKDVAAEDSGDQLTALIGQVAGRTDLVVCVDGLGPLLRGRHGTDHLLELRRALKERSIHLIGVLAGHDYEDLVAADHVLQELTSRIDMAEPERDAARDMVRLAADALEKEFTGIRVEHHAVARAVVLAGDFVRHQRLPLSAVKVLRRACEDLDYARRQLGDERSAVTLSEVADVVAELSGMPREQIAGTGGERVDYATALRAEVVGQERAVRVVADELRRIKAGLAAVSSGPASVLLFAGLTGVGKTELAKRIAGLYSASKRLQTYPMENYTEPHSVSGILGSPPGYVGHERGGRLINELNSDPYCVFLLDEAEKAHPEVLRPFLNLFDEGWITDQRGVKAHGDRAIFILTTNAGHEIISRLGEDSSDEEISVAVRKKLAAERSRDGTPVFTPEFLARIRRVIVFRPLDGEAMTAIGRKVLDRQRAFWREKREKELIVPEELVRHAGDLGHGLNSDAGGREGGRIMAKVLSDLVENPVLAAAEERPEEFQACDRIVVEFAPPPRTSARDELFSVPGASAATSRTRVRFLPPEEPADGAQLSSGEGGLTTSGDSGKGEARDEPGPTG
ncbi:ATP-dependent Clp protease ATP-binding subunit [Streptomyces antnestii]|uniref:ATP-dependent Clp protease ATP-binding subunit n=1 Tax=Streptomyces antnestii TaxID=2494256 RepID=A0A3S2WAK8_9ACTN|nr:AAA family ATPase [Streptomyces sp. San01]RVU17992.1 ATP-dependent Clp protease ATP-binding subunit [Streptomyces sp. San01]